MNIKQRVETRDRVTVTERGKEHISRASSSPTTEKTRRPLSESRASSSSPPLPSPLPRHPLHVFNSKVDEGRKALRIQCANQLYVTSFYAEEICKELQCVATLFIRDIRDTLSFFIKDISSDWTHGSSVNKAPSVVGYSLTVKELKGRCKTTTTAGKYKWQTYKEVYEVIQKVGSSIHSCGYGQGMKCGIYGANCPGWIISMEACNAHGLYYVPLYDTLGAGAVEFIICHAEISIAFVEEKKIPELLKTFPNASKFLKTLVSFEKFTPEQKQQVENFGVKSYSWDEFLQVVVNRTGQLTGYKLVPGSNCLPLARPEAKFLRRAAFLKPNLWVSPYAHNEMHPRGEFPNQNPRVEEGLLSQVILGNDSKEESTSNLTGDVGKDFAHTPSQFIGKILNQHKGLTGQLKIEGFSDL
ncbi:hypothetical protein HN51_041821, partial [Arachis hypogaea]